MDDGRDTLGAINSFAWTIARPRQFVFNAILMYRLFWFSLSPQKQKGAVLGSPKRCVKVGQGGGQQTKVAGGKKEKE